MSRSITKEILVNQPIDRVFGALVTPSLIRQWWFASRAIIIPETGGRYDLAWGEEEDNPDYISAARIEVFDRPHRLLLTDFQYHSKDGPLPFEGAFENEFRLEKTASGTRLIVRQAGFPEESVADDFYRSCVQGWVDTLGSFKRVMEGEK